MMSFVIIEIGSKSTKRTFLADGFMTILLVLIEHRLVAVVIIKSVLKNIIVFLINAKKKKFLF